MRLINTEFLTLEEHPDSRLPAKGYAILSHRWYNADEEVTFHDLQFSQNVAHKRGFAKLKGFCDMARSMGYDYAWSDTCCINKDSATELGTALNSMFRWYGGAEMCIAYLEDVHENGRRFEDSEWFERGWTLQELIAPKSMCFYDCNWLCIGTKHNLLDRLAKRTKVPNSILNHTTELHSCSVAQRMSWAADRITERVEDRAYSLVGLFNISLSMLYGEGEKAFIRLQENIIRQSADRSIFAWSLDRKNHASRHSGMLAPSPSSFGDCNETISVNENKEFSLSNIGLSITLPTLPYSMEVYYALLGCTRRDLPKARYAILLARLPESGQWARVMNHNDISTVLLSTIAPGAKLRHVRVRQTPVGLPISFRRAYGFWLRTIKPPRHETSNMRVLSRAPSSEKGRVYLEPGMMGSAGVVSVEPTHSRSQKWSRLRWIKVGFDDEFNPVVMIANDSTRAIPATFSKDFDDVMNPEPAVAAHARLFQSAWVRNDGVISKQVVPSTRNGWAAGFYVKIPDRIIHENQSQLYTIRDLNLGIRLSLLPDYSLSNSFAETSHQARFIWTIDLTDLKGPSPEASRHEEQCLACFTTLFGFPLALMGCGCVISQGLNDLCETCR